MVQQIVGWSSLLCASQIPSCISNPPFCTSAARPAELNSLTLFLSLGGYSPVGDIPKLRCMVGWIYCSPVHDPAGSSTCAIYRMRTERHNFVLSVHSQPYSAAPNVESSIHTSILDYLWRKLRIEFERHLERDKANRLRWSEEFSLSEFGIFKSATPRVTKTMPTVQEYNLVRPAARSRHVDALRPGN